LSAPAQLRDVTESRISTAEFIVLVALLNAMVAMSIDTMLPALGTIATELGARLANDRQLILTMFFGGMTVGTLVSGPVSDSTGRKPAILVSLTLYAVGAALCLVSTNFTALLAGRFVQGFGAAGPRIVSIAMVRDGQKGAAMARIMSFVMSVFMLVPIMAPSIGQLVLLVASWRVIFAGFVVMALIAALWLGLRQEETLPHERRQEFSVTAIMAAAWAVVTNRIALGYTLAVGCIFGSFICYLGTSQQIFGELYGQGKLFALWFGLFAVGIAIAMMFNARLVMAYGMRRLSKWALRLSIAFSLIFFAVALLGQGLPPLWTLGVYLFCNFFCCGMLFGNYNAIAMEPMGRVAGMAAAISGALSTLVALATGTLIGRFYEGNAYVLVAGFLIMGLAALVLTEWAERHRPKA
jgi:DHA1 family bicyclomycin/chloramphenicol resistance-like MFS transporter